MSARLLPKAARIPPLRGSSKVFRRSQWRQITSTANSIPPVHRTLDLSSGLRKTLRSVIEEQELREFKLDRTLVSLNSDLARAVKRNGFSMAIHISQRIAEQGLQPDHDTYNSLLRLYGENGFLQDAWALISDMESVGLTPQVEAFNCLLQAAENTPDAIHPILTMMRANEIQSNPDTYERIMAHHANFMNIGMCIQTLHDMEMAKVAPTLRTINLVVSAAAGSGSPKLALDIALSFEGTSFRRLDSEVFLQILSASAEVYYVDGIQIAWRRVVVTGKITPDEGLLNQILHACARHGLTILATDVLTVMKKADILLQEHHVAALMDSFVQAGQIKEAFRLLSLLKSDTVVPTSETTHSLLKAISKNVDALDNAYQYITDLGKDTGRLEVSVFNAVISAAITLQDIPRAFGIYKEAAELGVAPNVDTFNALLTGCISIGHRALGNQLLLDARNAGVDPDAGMYERLIVLVLTQAAYEDAFFYLEEMKGAGFKPTYKVYDALVRRTFAAFDPRWKLALEEMEEAGYRPTAELKEFIDTKKERY